MNLLICLLYILVPLEPASKERTNSNILWLNLRQWRGDRPTDRQVEVSMIYVLRRWVCKRIFTPTLPPMVKIDIFSWEIITHILCSPKRIVRRYRRNSPVHEAFQRAPITQSLQPNIFYWRFSLYYSVYFVYSTGPGRGTVPPKKKVLLGSRLGNFLLPTKLDSEVFTAINKHSTADECECLRKWYQEDAAAGGYVLRTQFR